MNQDPNQQHITLRPTNKLLLVIIALLAFALVAVGIVAASRSNAPTCITPEDYLAFYGEAPFASHFEPKVSFFQKDYSFLPSSATLDDNESDSPTIDAKNLAEFYIARAHKPIVFTVRAVYKKDDTSSKILAEQRVQFITDALTRAGIPANLIASDISDYTVSDDTPIPDAADAVSLTLASAESCEE